MLTEIVHNLWIGTIHDAIYDKTNWSLIICCAEWDNFSAEERDYLMVQNRAIAHVPFMKYSRKYSDDPNEPCIMQDCEADINKLNLLAALIPQGLLRGRVLVHCAAGVERSPLAVSWYLLHYRSEFKFNSLEEAFALVKSKRPNVENRLDWIRKNDSEEINNQS